MPSSRIAVLDREVAEKVAAGEVVQRPADAVKELIENAIDAILERPPPDGRGRRGSIQVEVRGGGLELIRVADDGCGIPAGELELALARHGTSKLRQVDDLSRVRTLGFRGEALPSIGAVAELTVVSRPADAASGACLVLEGGRVREIGARGCPLGTQVTVRRLFFNLPARLAFQRSAGGEGAHIAHLVGVYALAYPELRFTLTVDGRRALEVGGGDRREVMSGVYGLEAAVSMLPIEAEDPAGVAVRGLISRPDLTRGSRGDILLYANRRPVQNRSLSHAVVDAYRGFLPEARFPIVVLDVGVSPEEIDVNVSPSKAEVRFRRERLVYAAVQRSIRSSLLAVAPPPAVSTPLRQAEGFGPAAAAGRIGPPGAAPIPPTASADGRAPPEGPSPDGDGGPPAAPAAASVAAGGVRLPILRIVGQVQSTYIVCEGPDGVYFVDQHAAHERVLYERILAERGRGGVARQQLLTPAVVDLTARSAAQLREHLPELGRLGFEVEPFGDRSALVRAIPAGLIRADPAGALAELVEALASPGPSPDGLDRGAATVACHAAVRAGDPLSTELMRELIEQLEATDIGRFCPHGRPTVVRLPATQLERDFGRR
ncbi:MAG TPA: DNA mismatch repair endonuclease MutL [Chloroflexota bacterium]